MEILIDIFLINNNGFLHLSINVVKE